MRESAYRGRGIDRGVDRERAYFVGDDPAITIRVDRSAQGDAIEIQEKVQEKVDELMETLPEGTKMQLIRTRADHISGRLDMLFDNALTGLGLVIILLFLFLNVRTAFWVAAGIPTAICAAIALMYAAGITINMISLFALLITLGIVVDDAIVVGEHADQRARMGLDPIEAAETAAHRMALPVFAATATTIIAFFGLVAVVAVPFGQSPPRRSLAFLGQRSQMTANRVTESGFTESESTGRERTG